MLFTQTLAAVEVASSGGIATAVFILNGPSRSRRSAASSGQLAYLIDSLSLSASSATRNIARTVSDTTPDTPNSIPLMQLPDPLFQPLGSRGVYPIGAGWRHLVFASASDSAKNDGLIRRAGFDQHRALDAERLMGG